MPLISDQWPPALSLSLARRLVEASGLARSLVRACPLYTRKDTHAPCRTRGRLSSLSSLTSSIVELAVSPLFCIAPLSSAPLTSSRLRPSRLQYHSVLKSQFPKYCACKYQLRERMRAELRPRHSRALQCLRRDRSQVRGWAEGNRWAPRLRHCSQAAPRVNAKGFLLQWMRWCWGLRARGRLHDRCPASALRVPLSLAQ